MDDLDCPLRLQIHPMTTFSLLNVSATNSDGTVDGYWMQDYTGSYKEALEKAARTEVVNSNRINVAVVEKIDHPTPMLEYWTNRVRSIQGC